MSKTPATASASASAYVHYARDGRTLCGKPVERYRDIGASCPSCLRIYQEQQADQEPPITAYQSGKTRYDGGALTHAAIDQLALCGAGVLHRFTNGPTDCPRCLEIITGEIYTVYTAKVTYLDNSGRSGTRIMSMEQVIRRWPGLENWIKSGPLLELTAVFENVRIEIRMLNRRAS